MTDASSLQDFATAKVSPWSFVWLVQDGDWDHLERVIHLNCILLGGIDNAIVPFNDLGIPTTFGPFVSLYDPDFVVLPPGVDDIPASLTELLITPFAIVRWDQIQQIMTDDATSRSSTWAASVQPFTPRKLQAHEKELIAIEDPQFPDTSRLAFLACGDVSPAKPDWDEFDGQAYLDAHGYREERLERMARWGARNNIKARLGDADRIIHAPSRSELALLIEDEYKFPLHGTRDIFEACCRLQHGISGHFSFITRTTNHRGGTAARRLGHIRQTPAMTIIVSDHFEFAEAILFWNLRANHVIVTWASFDQLQNEGDTVCHWLDSDVGGSFYAFAGDIAFTSSKQNASRLADLFESLTTNRLRRYPEWIKVSYEYLHFYDRERPALDVSYLMVRRESEAASFLSNYPTDVLGYLGLTLEWPPTKLPQTRAVANLLSAENLYASTRYNPHIDKQPPPLEASRFRITSARDVRLSISDRSPVSFNVPRVVEVFRVLFSAARFQNIREGSYAQYQKIFIRRAGDIYSASRLLHDSSYREFFHLLANSNQNAGLPGWILREPKRRALKQSDLTARFASSSPAKAHDSNDENEKLPDQIQYLLGLELLERGFQLTCSLCSAKIWYRVEEVGQSFTCNRCYEQQKLVGNPVWLYKLPEVVNQFFVSNADVALLALSTIAAKSGKQFSYMLDFDVFQGMDTKGQNIDFGCLSHGLVYIGEAKTVDNIDEKQFSFYSYIARRVRIDGLVFATTAAQWNASTSARIDQLKKVFFGDVQVLTKEHLLNTN